MSAIGGLPPDLYPATNLRKRIHRSVPWVVSPLRRNDCNAAVPRDSSAHLLALRPIETHRQFHSPANRPKLGATIAGERVENGGTNGTAIPGRTPCPAARGMVE